MKYHADLQPGDSFEPVEYTVTREMIDSWCKAMGDDHPAYTDGLPGIGPVAGHTFAWYENLLMLGRNTLVAGPVRLQYRYDCMQMRPRRLGETLRVEGGCVERFTRGDHDYVVIEYHTYGSEKEPISTYRNTTCVYNAARQRNEMNQTEGA